MSYPKVSIRPALLGRVVLAAGLLAGMLAITSACNRSGVSQAETTKQRDAVTAAVVRVVQRDLSNQLQIASEFIPYQQINVHAEVSGYIKKLYIDWGTHVRTGQLMAVLEVPQLDAEVTRDKASVVRDEKDLERAREELTRAKSAYFVANVTYRRLYGVQKRRPDLVAQEEVDVAHGKQLEAAASVSAAQDALDAAQQALAADKATLQRDEAMYHYSFITAPFDGVVTRLDAYTGALLPAGTSSSTTGLPLCRLSQNDLLRLVIPVPEQVVQDVQLGEAVNVQVPSLKRTFQGKVSRISDEINLETRTMHTEVEVPNPAYVLIPGMYAYVQVPVKSAENALTLPIQAVEIHEHGQGTVLVVNREDQIEPRQVRLGIETSTAVQILSGVHEGEMAVFGEFGSLQAGEKVKPEPANLAAVGGG